MEPETTNKGDVDLAALEAAWTAAGLDPKGLPSPADAETALRRAVRELSAKRRLARPLARRGHWALVNEDVSQGAPSYATAAEVQVDKAGTLTFSGAVDPELRGAIERQFAEFLGRLVSYDVGGWLVGLAYGLKAVALRETGGVYFVPRPSLDAWRRAAGVLRSVSSCRVYELPAMRTDEAVEAVLDGLRAEADAEAAAMERDLADESLGERALRTRAGRCRAMSDKVASYGELLGRSMADMTEKFERLQADLAAAALAAAAEAKAA